MSLIHWWPLNGDLKDYGLFGSSIGSWSGGATYTSGKIGQCISCNSSSYPTLPYTVSATTGTFSLTFWIKIPSAAASSSHGWYNVISLAGIEGSSNTSIVIGWTDYNNLKIYDMSHQFWWLAPGNHFTYDQWFHIAIVQTPDNTSTTTLYINGIKIGTQTKDSVLQLKSGNLQLGKGLGLSLFYFNDFRIYDHALSAKEVKELSKGLVLHYDFNDPYVEGTTNRYAYSGENPYWSLTFYDGATGNYGYNADSNGQCECVTAIDKYGKSKKMIKVSLRTARRTQPYVHFDYLSGYIDNQTYATVSFDMYSTCATSVGPYSYYSGYYFSYWNDTTKQWVGGSSTSIQIPNLKINQWNHIVFRIYRDTTEYNSGPGFCPVGTSSSTSDYWLFDNIQIEAKDHATPYVNGTRAQKVNLLSSITAGGNVTKDSNSDVHTNGSNVDTYFYLSFSKDMEYGKKYYISCDVAGFANSNEWWFFPICSQNYSNNGIYFKNGKCGALFEYLSSESRRVILDDLAYSSSSVRTENIYITNIRVYEAPDIYDCSGYKNDAIIIGDIPTRQDSGNGKYCLDLSNDGIFIETNKMNFLNTGTVIFWAKYPSSSTSDSKMLLSASYGTSYYIGAADTNNNWYHANVGTLTAYRDGVASNTLLRDDKWHCYAFTGVNLSSCDHKLSITNYASNTLPEKYRFHGKIADIKIYNTILSASDILAEYNRKASIDKSGILFTGEFEEGNSTNINVTKTAMVKCNNIVEGTTNVKFIGGYTQLEYIESTGTQYIDTGIVINNNYEFILEEVNNFDTNNHYMCGSSGNAKMLGTLNNVLWSNGILYSNVTFNRNTKEKIGFKVVTDGSTGSDYLMRNYTTNTKHSGRSSFIPTGSGTVKVFSHNGSTKEIFKCYDFKLFKDDMLVSHLIPAKRNSDNVLGMYDLVNKTFLTNAGSGTFTAGPEIGKINAIYANEIKEI